MKQEGIPELPNDFSPTTNTGPEISLCEILDTPSQQQKNRKSVQDTVKNKYDIFTEKHSLPDIRYFVFSAF